LSKQQQKREPLLYIHQPEFQPPKVKMQEAFSAKQAEKRKQQLLKLKQQDTTVESVEKKAVRKMEVQEERVFGAKPIPKEPELSIQKVQETIEEYENSNVEENQRSHGFSFKRVKPFREMNIDEKLDYLANFPRQLPPVPCLFQTENKAMRGLLKEKSGDVVVLKLFDKTEVSVPINDLIEVRMIGL
jgi:hypothetical protein